MGMEAEVENLRGVVGRYFRVYDTIVHPLAITFKVMADPKTLDANFEGLRRELVPQNYVPAIGIEAGEHVVHVQRRPAARFAKPYVNVILLTVTVATTFVAGALNWAEYVGLPLMSLESLTLGFLAFSVPLLTILGSHEMGHYLVSKRYHVRASLPFFLPSVPPLGTFGAFISMRDPIPNRKALLDIGVSGPLVGFLVSIPVLFLGLWLTALNPVVIASNAGGQVALGPMVLFDLFLRLVDIPENVAVHPTVFAGWVGLFVTSINLLPAGQLDGGHIAHALLGERAAVLSWATILGLLVMGIALYPSWLIFALVILMLGARHPPPLNNLTALPPPRKLIAGLAIVLLLLTFAPAPFVQLPTERRFQFESAAAPDAATSTLNHTAVAGNASTVQFRVKNTGNVKLAFTLELDRKNLDRSPFGWTIDFTTVRVDGRPPIGVAGAADFALNSSEVAVVAMQISVPQSSPRETYDIDVIANVAPTTTPTSTLTIRVTVVPP